MATSLRVQLLDQLFQIECSDPLILELVATMWDVPPGNNHLRNAHTIQIDISDEGWVCHAAGQDSTRGVDRWKLLAGLRYLIDELLLSAREDLVAFHGVVVRRDDHVALIAGEAGAGKTSIGLELVARGWSLICDDLALFDPDRNELLALPRPIGVRSSGAASSRARALWKAPPWMSEPRGHFFLPIPAVRWGEGGPVTHVFFPHRSEETETGTATLDPGLAASRLTVFARTMDARALGAAVRLASKARSVELVFHDVDSAVSAIGRC